MDKRKLTIIVEPDGDSFHAFCPQLRGLHVSGETEDAALRNAGDAVFLYLESLKREAEAARPKCQ